MKCSTKIWSNFSTIEKLLWTDFYNSFIFSGNFPPEWENEKSNQEIVAHNIACEAVWTLQTYLQDFVKNHPCHNLISKKKCPSEK